jgi:hypothetical protein
MPMCLTKLKSPEGLISYRSWYAKPNVAAADDPDRLTSQIRRVLCRVGSALFADAM